ncbi:MAG: DUF2520 domain-containing protein [Tannerella sp.]|jgi:predicted short-subunit dehydrogenase-like oxidoreductase (DUF2520 family)|nr:DUF2520 domain-containing protein [Tannerella sp.]
MKPSHIEEKNVVFIGAGNVATHLSLAMKNAGFSIRQIFSRSENSAKSLAEKLNCNYTTDVKEILPDADIYLFSLKDDVLQDIVASVPPNNGLWIHTAGSIPMDLFRGYAEYYGVIYPMQTLSKQRHTNFFKVPLFIEGNTKNNEDKIYDIAQMLSGSVTHMASDKRRHLHLAAVFACNFSNHMYSLAAKILEEQDIDWHILQPLIDETANKLYSMSPGNAQTGPAVRYDRHVIERHLSMLKDEDTRKLYLMISENIHARNVTNKK